MTEEKKESQKKESEEKEPEEKREEPTEKISRRAWLILILILAVVVETVVFSSIYRASQEDLKKAQIENEQMFSKIETANEQIEALEAEKSRCTTILNQLTGEFAEYEYCKKLLRKFSL